MPSGITMATLGDTVVLQCIVDAYPAPKMMFWRDPKGREAVIQSGKYSTNIIESKTVIPYINEYYMFSLGNIFEIERKIRIKVEIYFRSNNS